MPVAVASLCALRGSRAACADAAIHAKKPIITVLLDQGGYQFEDSRTRLGGDLADWGRGMPEAAFHEPLTARLAKLPQPPALGDVQRALYSTLTSTIAIQWQPHAGPNHYEAVLADIAAAINRHKSSRGMRMVVRHVSSKMLLPKTEASCV